LSRSEELHAIGYWGPRVSAILLVLGYGILLLLARFRERRRRRGSVDEMVEPPPSLGGTDPDVELGL
jgi:hypothetical protein